MKRPRYLVTGATGVAGGYAINSLLNADASFREKMNARKPSKGSDYHSTENVR